MKFILREVSFKLYKKSKQTFSMQILEVIELKEFPFMETNPVIEGTTVRDIINEKNSEKVFILIDYDTKKIWTYNGPKSPLKLQIYGGIIAGMYRKQLKGWFRPFTLNLYSKDHKIFQEILEKPLGGGQAKPIEKSDFSIPTQATQSTSMIIENPKLNKAMEYFNEIPQPPNLIRRFLIIGGSIYTDEEITEALITEKKIITQPVKLGRLNNGFTFFKDHNYSTRLIIKERKIQGIELYIDEKDRAPSLKLKVPVIFEEKFSKPGKLKDLIKAFQIPKQISQDKENPPQNDSVNKS